MRCRAIRRVVARRRTVEGPCKKLYPAIRLANEFSRVQANPARLPVDQRLSRMPGERHKILCDRYTTLF